MKTIFLKMLSLVCCFAFAFSSFSAQSKQTETFSSSQPVNIDAFSQSAFEIKPSGSIEKITAQSANIGETETLFASLLLRSDLRYGEKFIIKIESKAIDLSQAKASVVFNTKNAAQPINSIQLTPVGAKKEALELELEINSFFAKPSSTVSIIVSSPRVLQTGEVKLSVSNKKETSFNSETAVLVQSYKIKKQSPEAAKVEIAKGLPGMNAKDTVYIFEDSSSQELMRFVIQNGVALGLAKKDGAMIAGLIYDFERKVYINAINQKPAITKDEVVKIFEQLNFSFLKMPDESSWFAAQPTFKIEKSIYLN